MVGAAWKLAAEELRALAHPNEPVAALARRGKPRCEPRHPILDDEHGGVVAVVEPDVDAIRHRVAADVRQRLLGGAIHGEARVRRQLARLAAHLERDRHRALVVEAVDERRKPVRSGYRVTAGRRNGAARLVEAADGKVMGSVERSNELTLDVILVCQQARALEVERQRRERMREHVVQLARDPPPLGHRRRTRLGHRGDFERLVLCAHVTRSRRIRNQGSAPSTSSESTAPSAL